MGLLSHWGGEGYWVVETKAYPSALLRDDKQRKPNGKSKGKGKGKAGRDQF